MSKKKTILFHSAGSLLNTGFSRTLRTLFTALYKTEKYRLIEYANGPFRYSDPRLRKLPWESFGAIPDNDADIPPNPNPQTQALLNYGHFNIDKVVKETRPDVVIMAEDIWGVAPALTKPWIKKVNTIVWTPVDSLPLMELHKESAANCPHYWVKAPFAAKALVEAGITHAKTVPDLIDDKDFFPLEEQERLNLRRQIGLEDDCFVIGFVFRNQLRKLVGTLLDGFKIFQDKNPTAKVKLLLHTDYREPQWNIPLLMSQIGIKNEDVLTSYVCHNCKNVQIMPHRGQEVQCPICRKNALFTAGVDLGVTDAELNFVYNLMDAYFHPITSGGFEMPCFESMLAGVPLATVPYSSCEAYTQHPDVYAFECSYYREVNSGFWKSQPSPESIGEAINHFYSMSRSERKEIGLTLRKWSLDKFGAKKWIEWIENYIDALPEIDYSFDFDTFPHDDFPIPITEEPVGFLKCLYSGVFGADLDQSHPEFANALAALQRGITREQIYNDFIENARNVNRQKKKNKMEDVLEETGNKRLLFICPNGADDCIASLPVLESLFENYKDYDFYVATEPAFFNLFNHLTQIKRLLPYELWMDNHILLEGQGESRGHFDIVLGPYLITKKNHSYSRNSLDKDQLNG